MRTDPHRLLRKPSILLTLRHNLTQELLADIHTVSQSTISRVVAVYTPLIAEALQAWVPDVGDLESDRQYIIDGTLIERVIANLKTWRVLHTDYRRPTTPSKPQYKPSPDSSLPTPHE